MHLNAVEGTPVLLRRPPSLCSRFSAGVRFSVCVTVVKKQRGAVSLGALERRGETGALVA